ncbi:mechanosensitive ion channel family protein [Allomesorhizobium alhagi]|uniref:Mechanosensitive ion channel MscS n=1 Tax=Mesorhizobium alhagi CCNWXJ12-2 TaxID=1107882 RepID=H0HKA5_9HYPH|nr:mechanosensitive ion channel family protein [Mesorhizobium alhagi]EHK58825.1 mechanosensitive ion channel MscS [Mesorhizobium alhagi CCNWXJ12-2]
MISRIKALRFTVPAVALLVLVGLIGTSATSFAQTQSATPATNEKIEELVRLLDDPDVRAVLEAAKPAGADPELPAAAQIAEWEDGIRGHLAAILNAFPRLPDEAANGLDIVHSQIENHVFGMVWMLLGGLIALGFGAEWLFRRTVFGAPGNTIGANVHSTPRRGNLAASLLYEIAPLVVFTIFSTGVFLIVSWPPLLRLIVLTYLVAFIAFRLVAAISRIVLDPPADAGVDDDGASSRLIPLDDAEAHFWHRRLTVFAGYLLAGWATISLLSPLGFSDAARSLLSYLAGIGLVLLAIEIVWRRPGVQKATQASRARNWLLSIYIVALWGLWVAGLNGLLWLGIYALLLPRLLTVTGQAAASVSERRDAPTSANPFRTVLIVRGARALVVLLAVLWLGLIWRMNPNALTDSDSAISRLMYGLLHGIIILLVADLLWHMAKAYIGRKLETATVDGSVSAAEAARRGRLRTLLPIFRNILGVFIATVAVLIVLSGLGVQIAPLIAGAGIFGVAIGFGSQTLVKDVISGVFYMLDDAFRVGEYIQSGSYKGTVESFSLRSVKLRHHRGPVFTVPFGSLGAVQNMSRDWVIDKFMIRVPFDTDIAKVKKLLKGVGAELKADPELGPEILETVKMKGVEEIGDFGIQLSFAFMAKPGHQSVVRRRAYTMISQAFRDNGIDFAQPTVQVGGDEKSAAAAAPTTAMMRKKAAEPVQA